MGAYRKRYSLTVQLLSLDTQCYWARTHYRYSFTHATTLMRIIHTFIYSGNKSCKIWELTVGLYYLFLRDPESALEQLLSEYNDILPQFTHTQLERLLDIIFEIKHPKNKLFSIQNSDRNTKELGSLEKDFHLHYVSVCKQIQWDCRDMPLRIFQRIVDDIDILIGKKEYDPQRHQTHVDKQGLRDVMGQSSVLYHH